MKMRAIGSEEQPTNIHSSADLFVLSWLVYWCYVYKQIICRMVYFFSKFAHFSKNLYRSVPSSRISSHCPI